MSCWVMSLRDAIALSVRNFASSASKATCTAEPAAATFSNGLMSELMPANRYSPFTDVLAKLANVSSADSMDVRATLRFVESLLPPMPMRESRIF